MNTSRAICTLESMAIDMVGTLGGLDKASPIAPVLERQIEAINKAQDALRVVRDLATNENASHISIERMNEIMQAEREGRLVILPCKVGDTVYHLGWKYSECHLGYTPPHRPYVGCEGCCEECDSEKTAWLYSGKVVAIVIADEEPLVRIRWKGDSGTDLHMIGKTVFLSREEAVKKLEESNALGR